MKQQKRYVLNIAVALACLALVNAGIDDVAPEQALVTTHLETVHSVEDPPEYEFLNDDAFLQEIAEASQIDTDKLLRDQKAEAKKKYVKLKAEQPKQKAKKKAAKRAFRSGRKALRENFRKCKKTITKKNPTLSSPKCAIFRTKELMALQQEEEGTLVTVVLDLGKGKRRASRKKKRKMKRGLRKLRRKRRASRKKKRKMKRGLRKLRRKRRRQLCKKWREAKKAYRKFKKKLRGARFQLKVVPNIFKMLKPKIDKAMADMNSKNGAGKEGGGVVAGTPAKSITVQSVLRKYLGMSLHETIDPLLQKVFDTVMNLIWKLLDPAVAAIKTSIVGSVGSVPFVGGILASIAGAVIDKIYQLVKTAINNAVSKIRLLIQNKVVDAIVNVCFKSGFFKRNEAGAAKAGDAASNAISQATAKSYKKAELASEPAAKAAAQAVTKDAQRESDSLAKTNARDKAVDKEENDADDKELEEEDAEDAEDALDEEADELDDEEEELALQTE